MQSHITSQSELGIPTPEEMTSDAHVISTRYTKSVIKSCAALSYVEAQARMDDRIYPKGTRITCSIFKPLTAWLHGAQMVAFNMQSVRRRLLDEGTCAAKSSVTPQARKALLEYVGKRNPPVIEYDDTQSWANVDDFLVWYLISVLFSLFCVLHIVYY
ncbi:exosome complex exonuclease RRP44 homolog A [Tanacetum coccineum]